MIDPSRIVQHKDWQEKPYVDFISDATRRGGHAMPPPAVTTQGEVVGYINHGRWVVDCPFDGGAAIINIDEAVFFCPVCGNVRNDGQWYKVTLPPPGLRAQIEKALLARPADDGFNAPTRNWRPGETVAMLKNENRQQGLPETT